MPCKVRVELLTIFSLFLSLSCTGALIVGGLNMHEIGIGVTGQNVHYGATRNPYNLQHHTGGSSAGSAASVAAGFFPLTIGESCEVKKKEEEDKERKKEGKKEGKKERKKEE